LVTVARNQESLQHQAQALEQRFGIQVRPLSIDLSQPHAATKVIEATRDLEIGILIPNAAVIDAQHLFSETPAAFCERMMQLNVHSVMQLAHHFSARMQQRRRGAILFVSSLSGLMPQPLLALYGATKAFVFSLASSLSVELKPVGVQISVLSPGPTRTELLASTGMKHEAFGMPVATPESVAWQALNGLSRGHLHIIPGVMNKISVFINRLTPTAWAATIIDKVMRLGYKSPAKTWNQ
jgi:short-subunit dehydrogenase